MNFRLDYTFLPNTKEFPKPEEIKKVWKLEDFEKYDEIHIADVTAYVVQTCRDCPGTKCIKYKTKSSIDRYGWERSSEEHCQLERISGKTGRKLEELPF